MDTEIMTLREAAEYLKLTEKVLTRLAQDGRLPAQKLARQWRFQRRAVEAWKADRAATPVTEQELPPEATGLPSPVTVTNAIAPVRINLNLTAQGRDTVLRELSALVIDPGEGRLFETLVQALRVREDLCPTCVSEGVAIPHARSAIVGLVETPVLAYGRHLKGLDFGAFDKKPIHHFFLLCAPNVRDHLQLLSRLSRLVIKPDFRAKLMKARRTDDVLTLITDAERLIPGT